MSPDDAQPRFPRRSFLARVTIGTAGVGAAFGSGAAAAQTPGPGGPWQPARHAEDDWLDQPSARHRLFIDTTTPDALGMALLYANNFYTASRSGYGLADSDSAVVICMRHQSTGFAFTDAVWTKYSASLADAASFTDPRVKQPPTVNIYEAAGPIAGLLNRGVTIQSLTARGLRVAVCQMATRGIAMRIAGRNGGNVDEIYKELVDNRVPNSHMVPAGIVALSRAQEHGYTFASTS